MVAIIRGADCEQVSILAKRHGISEQTIYTWRKRFGGFHASDVRRLRQLEAENGRVRSPRVIDVLSRLISKRGAPNLPRSDNGPEFVLRALLSWIVGQGIDTAMIELGKPWQNGFT